MPTGQMTCGHNFMHKFQKYSIDKYWEVVVEWYSILWEDMTLRKSPASEFYHSPERLSRRKNEKPTTKPGVL